jgi:hypothetical protein
MKLKIACGWLIAILLIGCFEMIVAPGTDYDPYQEPCTYSYISRSHLLDNLLLNPGFEEDSDNDGLPDHWHTFMPMNCDVITTLASALERYRIGGVSV